MRLLNRYSLAAVILAAGVTLAGCGSSELEITTTAVSVRLGSDSVDVLVRKSEAAGLTYVNLHDDENTGAAAAQAVLRSHGGRLVELRHSGEREVTYERDGVQHTFDPNRVFTDSGLDSIGAGPAVEDFAREILAVMGIDSLRHVVSVHNNSDEEYSIRSYMPGGRHAVDARFAHVAADRDRDDFFFVTDEEIYADLRDSGFNVVLQDVALATDDGSLSILSDRRGIPYVNVEAEHGHFEVQRKMLVFLHDLLARPQS